MPKVLALNKDGQLTYCSVPENERGKGRCNHIAHQLDGESVDEFISKINEKIMEDSGIEPTNNFVGLSPGAGSGDTTISEDEQISQEEIDELIARIDKIAGCKVTPENLEEVLTSLDPESVRQITEIGFNAAQEFSLPITDERFEEERLDNNLYFATLPRYGIAGKMTSIAQMFEQVGDMPGPDGEVFIAGNYRDGLTPSEYFDKLYSGREASIAKSVSTALPGYSVFALQPVEVLRR